MVETLGAIFVPLKSDCVDRLQDWLQTKNYNGRDSKKIVVSPENSFAVVEEYGRTSHAPRWLPSREKTDDPLTVPQTGILPELSINFGEAFAFIMFDDHIDCQHWKEGKLVRFLDGNAEGWDTVSGHPDPWEEDFFFPLEKLDSCLNDLRDWEELTLEREAEIRKVWAEKAIRSGAAEPQAAGTARAIRIHYFPKNPFI
ncbi:MAG: hypothetical protein DCF19_22290 [Pseudanabaena frigida]|uniref:Uncharacterized protein n=1 Tax=Pseudanabaena frigida TaxID=945775 RepID=A0A2W4W279_9CYAN|nr:MAG: hypothetical protein DCF19_22290 [Pseudanabaena frigida]